MIRSQWRIAGEKRPASVQEVIEILLQNRSVDTSFLNGTLRDLEPHLAIRGMDEGAELMAQHLSEGNKLVLVGDYDCDGITSLAQVVLFLKDIGYRNYDVVIPQRAEGYGVPERAVLEHPDAKLFLVMDCGTLDVKAVSMARARGCECIVIDHHEVPEKGLAPASVLINPKQPACSSEFKEFCSAGLTLLFLARLRRTTQKNFPAPNLGGKYLALAGIGTVADMVPLVGGNRILTRNGLCSMNAGTYLPARQIAAAAGLAGKCITAGHVGYYIGPRINAAGRIADARVALDLLTAEHPDEIERLAQELNRFNAKRQRMEDEILAEVRRRFTEEDSRKRTLVMGDSGWAAGIIGIIASRIQQEFHYGPTIVFSVDEAGGTARGSARSVPGFDVHSALKCCDDLLLKWGGHKMAAGMTVSLDRMKAFVERFEEVAQNHPAEIFIPKGKVDMELDLRLVSAELVNTLRQLEPHGLGNATPMFAARKARVAIQRAFGRDQNHLRILLDDRVEGVFWRGVPHQRSGQWNDGDHADVIFSIEWDDYRDRPALNIKDIGHFFREAPASVGGLLG